LSTFINEKDVVAHSYKHLLYSIEKDQGCFTSIWTMNMSLLFSKLDIGKVVQ